jgi:hypothetical protein
MSLSRRPHATLFGSAHTTQVVDIRLGRTVVELDDGRIGGIGKAGA